MFLADAVERWALVHRAELDDDEIARARLAWTTLRRAPEGQVDARSVTSAEVRAALDLFDRRRSHGVAAILEDVIEWVRYEFGDGLDAADQRVGDRFEAGPRGERLDRDDPASQPQNDRIDVEIDRDRAAAEVDEVAADLGDGVDEVAADLGDGVDEVAADLGDGVDEVAADLGGEADDGASSAAADVGELDTTASASVFQAAVSAESAESERDHKTKQATKNRSKKQRKKRSEIDAELDRVKSAGDASSTSSGSKPNRERRNERDGDDLDQGEEVSGGKDRRERDGDGPDQGEEVSGGKDRRERDGADRADDRGDDGGDDRADDRGDDGGDDRVDDRGDDGGDDRVDDRGDDGGDDDDVVIDVRAPARESVWQAGGGAAESAMSQLAVTTAGRFPDGRRRRPRRAVSIDP